MKLNQLILLILSFLITMPAVAATTKRDTIGCPNMEDTFRTDQLAGDDDAVAKFVHKHSCSVITANVTVTPEKNSIQVSCVRPKGEPDCLWVFCRDLNATQSELNINLGVQ